MENDRVDLPFCSDQIRYYPSGYYSGLLEVIGNGVNIPDLRPLISSFIKQPIKPKLILLIIWGALVHKPCSLPLTTLFFS